MSATESIRLDQALERWRRDNWPPKNLRQYSDLPLYIGGYEHVKAFSETLADALQPLAPHIYELQHARVPRWMAIPKVVFNVVRVNLLQTQGKTSRRYANLNELFKKLNPAFKPNEVESLYSWEEDHPGCSWVAHLPLTDLRAYVFQSEDKPAERIRFMESGLVLCTEGIPEELPIQDHRTVIRRKRRDGYGEPLAISENGWRLYGRLSDGRVSYPTSPGITSSMSLASLG